MFKVFSLTLQVNLNYAQFLFSSFVTCQRLKNSQNSYNQKDEFDSFRLALSSTVPGNFDYLS